LVLQASADNEPGRGLPDLRNPQWNAGLSVNLPFDRKAERNSYRSAQIRYEQAVRALELQVDNIKLAVYNGLRNLELARRNYEASELGVQIGERRVVEQDLLAELGRSITENLISAQNEYADAKNTLTQALVEHNINRLSLWRDLGILRIGEEGMWEEINNVSNQ
jgi:outer membrane protein TolC